MTLARRAPTPAPSWSRWVTDRCAVCGAINIRGRGTTVPELHRVFWAFHRPVCRVIRPKEET